MGNSKIEQDLASAGSQPGLIYLGFSLIFGTLIFFVFALFFLFVFAIFWFFFCFYSLFLLCFCSLFCLFLFLLYFFLLFCMSLSLFGSVGCGFWFWFWRSFLIGSPCCRSLLTPLVVIGISLSM